MKLTIPFVIETDIKGDYNFFKRYMDQSEWIDTNTLYSEYVEYQNTMYESKPVYHYIKHISNYDMPLKKYLINLFKQFGVTTKDFRCDFFLTKPGGNMPIHVDGMSKVAFLIPLTKNTGPLICEHNSDKLELVYQTLTILNTQIPHGVSDPTEDRLLFRIAIHDCNFHELGCYKQLIA